MIAQYPATGQHYSYHTIEGTQIADLELPSSHSHQAPTSASAPTTSSSALYEEGSSNDRPKLDAQQLQTAYECVQSQARTRSTSTSKARPLFVDPAIVSMAKQPFQLLTAPRNDKEVVEPSNPTDVLAAGIMATSPSTLPIVQESEKTLLECRNRTITEPVPSALYDGLAFISKNRANELTENDMKLNALLFKNSNLDQERRNHSDQQTVSKNSTEQPEKRSGKIKRKKDRKMSNKQRIGIEDSSPELVRQKALIKGWRETPLLEDPEQKSSQRTPQAGEPTRTNKQKKGKQHKIRRDQNGWATKDATDIQDLPEFDFESNLSKFDKRSVFNQIKNEDTTADEDRLVSHNRIRPGTLGGKVLHPLENVLEKPHMSRSRGSMDFTSSESDDAIGIMDRDSTGGRYMKRAPSHIHLRQQLPQRQNSSNKEDNIGGHYSGGVVGRSGRSLPHQPNSFAYTGNNSPSISPRFGSGTPALRRGSSKRRPFLEITSSGCICPTVNPSGLAAIENVADAEFGLTADVTMESAGRGIAEVVLRSLNPGGRRLARENVRLNARPIIVILVGNHRSGARALAAARHLLPRGVRLVVCMYGLEKLESASTVKPNASTTASVAAAMSSISSGAKSHLNSFDKDVVRQLFLYRKAGGRAISWTAASGPQHVLRRLDAPAELIVDALLSSSSSSSDGRGVFDALSAPDRAAAFELVNWANRMKALVLAVDCPSGVSGTTGELEVEVDVNEAGKGTSLIQSFTRNGNSGNHQQYSHKKFTLAADIATSDTPNALYLQARVVVCVGAPRTGLLRAITAANSLSLNANYNSYSSLSASPIFSPNANAPNLTPSTSFHVAPSNNNTGGTSAVTPLMPIGASEWQLWAVDIGMNPAWRKHGISGGKGIRFGGDWVVALRLAGTDNIDGVRDAERWG